MDSNGTKQIDRDRILYRNNGTTCYMVIRGGEEPRLPYQVNTIRYNKIEGLIPVHFLIEDGEYQFFYDITCKESLFDQMKNQKYTLTEIRTILSDLYRCIRVMEEYLLDINFLIIEPEYIFSDKRKNEYCFCFYPEKKGTFEASFQGLLEYFMNFLDYQDENTVVLVYSMYQKARSKNMSFAEIMQGFCEIEERSKKVEEKFAGQDECREETEEKETEEKETDFCDRQWVFRNPKHSISDIKYRKKYTWLPYIPDVVGGFAAAMILRYLKEQYSVLSVGQRGLCIAALIGIAGICGCISLYLISAIKGKQEDSGMKDEAEAEADGTFGFEEYSFQGLDQWDQSDQVDDSGITYGTDGWKKKNSVRERIPSTVVMNHSGSICSGHPVLVSCNRTKSHDIVIDKDEILIGKIQGVVDFYLNGMNISRIHAKVFRDQEDYGIVDMGSTNGTYVNGERITEGKWVRLKNNDEVQLADIKFVFKTGEGKTMTDAVI